MFKEINLRNHSSLHKLFYSLKDDADYSKAMLELTNVISSLYDMVAKPDKDEK